LEGSVRKSGQRVRINAQMIDGSTGGHVWAERYDRKLEDIFAVQDEVTHAIIDALMVELGDEERVRREGRGKVNPEAYDCLLRARECLNQMSAKSLMDSRIMLMRAIELDPKLAAAYATLSIVYCAEFLNKWNNPGPNHLEQALEFARQACETDKNEPRAYYALAHCQMWLRNLDDAERAAQRALELDSNFAGGFAALGLVRDYSGRHEDAVGLFERALRLDPQYGMALQYLGRSQFALERYEEAERTFTRRLIHSPRSDMTRAFLASLYGHTGRVQDAHRLWQEVMEINPHFSVDHIRRVLPFRDPSWFDRYVAGLSKAGLEE
jgi:adenylate cyclase